MKGKFIKKLMAYALTAAMVVSTPMTAFATEFADNFSISDGDGNHEGGDQDTGTVSNTDTGTTILKNEWDNIEGIEIEPTSVTMRKGDQKVLTARITYKKDAEGNDLVSQEFKDLINTQIRWRSTNNQIVAVDAKIGSMTTCPIHANDVGTVTVSAGLDVDLDGKDDRVATATVTVLPADEKAEITSISWNTDRIAEEPLYAGREYNLNYFLDVNGIPYSQYVNEYDDMDLESVLRIGFTTEADPKVVTISQSGSQDDEGNNYQYSSLKIAKNLRTTSRIEVKLGFIEVDNTDDIFGIVASDGVSAHEDIDISESAVIEGSATATFDVEKGVPATRVTATKKSVKLDIGTMYDEDGNPDLPSDENLYAEAYDANDNLHYYAADLIEIGLLPSNTTDRYYTRGVSKNPNIATAQWVPEEEAFKIIGWNVGKTTITFEATNGKKVNVSVTVKATLQAITNVEVDDTYSGKNTPITITRVPAQNKDKLKIEVAPEYKNLKKIIKTKNTVWAEEVIPVANLRDDSIEMQIQVSGKNVEAKESNPFTIVQSDVDVQGIGRYIEGQNEGPNVTNKTEQFKYLPMYVDEDGNLIYESWFDKKDGQGNDEQGVWVAQYFPGLLEDADSSMIDSVSWKSSNPSIAYIAAENSGEVLIRAGSKPGTAKITLSYVHDHKLRNKSFRVKVTPVCTSIALKSYEVANVANKKVTLSVKQLLPKKTVDKVNWFVEGIYHEGSDLYGAPDEVINDSVDPEDADRTGKKWTFRIDDVAPTASANDTIKIRVASEEGVAVTYAYVHVLSEATRKVEFESDEVTINRNKMDLRIGQMAVISPNVTNGDVVTGYSINKHGVVKILALNNNKAIVCGVGQGKVTVTVQMASGKKAKITINVQ